MLMGDSSLRTVDRIDMIPLFINVMFLAIFLGVILLGLLTEAMVASCILGLYPSFHHRQCLVTKK